MEIAPTINNVIDNIVQIVSNFGLQILETIVIIIIGTKLIKWITKKVANMQILDTLDPNLRSFIHSGLSILLYVVLFIICASILGINTASFITVLASCGVAIGLAMQGALSNVAGGIMILLFHPFHVGDYIAAAGIEGTVKGISVFYTFFETPDNKEITVPNGTLTATSIVNYSAMPSRRVDLDFNVSYDNDLEEVKKVMLDTAKAHDLVFKDGANAPFARLSAHGDSTLTFTLRAWCKGEDYWTVYFDLIEAVDKAFAVNKINLAYPQMDVHMKQ